MLLPHMLLCPLPTLARVQLSHSHCHRPSSHREAPPLTVAAVHVKTVLNPGSSANEVVAASVVYLQRVRTDGPMSQVCTRGLGVPQLVTHGAASCALMDCQPRVGRHCWIALMVNMVRGSVSPPR